MKEAARVISELRYQYPLDVIATTMGHCPTEDCDNISRGGMECSDCLTSELAKYTGRPLAERYKSALAEVQQAHFELYERLEK